VYDVKLGIRCKTSNVLAARSAPIEVSEKSMPTKTTDLPSASRSMNVVMLASSGTLDGRANVFQLV